MLTGPDGAAKTETRAAAAWALDEILKLLHPFMPFITEELWQVTAEQGAKRDHMLALDAWPQHDGLDDADAEAEIGWVIDLITAIRSVRVEMNIPPATHAAVGAGGRIAANHDPGTALGGIRTSGWRGSPTFLSPIRRRRARCSLWCAAKSRRCRSRA